MALFDCFKKKPIENVKSPEVVQAPPVLPPNGKYPKGLTPELALDYQNKWDHCIVRPEFKTEIGKTVKKLVDPANRGRYAQVSQMTGVPINVISVIHVKESNIDFQTHLHNGDPLNARTVQVPRGRPVMGNPPFTWIESAVDALLYEATAQGFNLQSYIWDIPGTLHFLQSYNGMGYARRGFNSPYLWSYTNLYTRGRFVSDGHFDPNSVSKAPGCVCLLKELIS